MMYNHYIPGSNGVYRRHSIPITEHNDKVSQCEHDCKKTHQPLRPSCTSYPDIGDLLLLCITILLLIDADEGDTLTIIIAIAAFVFQL